MNGQDINLPGTVAPYIYGVLAISLVLALIRLTRGPTLLDRVVALDLVAVITIGFTVVTIIIRRELVFLTAAALLALVVFLGTIAFARYLQKRGRND